ncbi:MAG: 4-hydroxy-3-methylbut-2-enyl diphosphate reductase [Bacteroidales bacterium]|nr:4-hydroxy-3-methylbut-2-enyl diphosphate reductase [Bacteroidales bacterium]
MSVVIDENAGFCFGVVKAIAAAEEQLKDSHQLYCLGDIVHNNEEVQRLTQMGLKVIDHIKMESLPDTTVLIRAHGEPPSTYELAKSRNIRLIDATCPIVLALQKKIREGYEQMLKVGGQVVIFGKQGHAEVIGLNGQTNNSAIIISSPEDIDAIDFSCPIRLYSQTTKSREDYRQLIDNIEKRINQKEKTDFIAYNTICSRVANRATQLEEFARSVDLVFFVSGVNSSNGHYLYEYCRKVQPNTRMISSPEEIDRTWFDKTTRIGITGATSTPRWLMEQVREKIKFKG